MPQQSLAPDRPLRRGAWALLVVLSLAGAARADTRALELGGFAFELEVVVPGEPEQAFDAFTRETLAWWDHHFSERPKQLHFEPVPGGGFIEIFDDAGNGARHATVIYADRGKTLRFTGPLGFSGQALELVHSLDFAAVEGGTRLRLAVRAAGEAEPGRAATVERVWKHFLVERFKPYMESRAGR